MFTPFLLLALSPPPAGDSLTLAQAEAAALAHQPAVRQARGQTDAAAGRVEEARAGYLPQATLTGTYERTTGNFVPRPGVIPNNNSTPTPSWNTNTFNLYTAQLAASQLIYDFGQTSKRWSAAASNRDAAEATQENTSVQAILGVRRAYFQARAQRELVEVAAETVRNQEKHVKQIEAFVRAGIRPDIDLAQVRTALANAQVQLVGASNNYAVSIAQLNQAMGAPAGQPHTLADSDFPAVPGEDGATAPLVDEALRGRPDIAALERQRQAQEETLRSVRGSYGPALSAIASGTVAGVEIEHLVPNWFLGLQIAWPVLQGGFTNGQVHEARGTLDAIAAQEDGLRLQAEVDVEQGRLSVAAAKASITAANEALVNAREQLRLAEGRYANGLGSAIELDDAQVAYSNASAQDVQARYALAAARAQLLAAVGTR
jgi:outer membrane protein